MFGLQHNFSFLNSFSNGFFFFHLGFGKRKTEAFLKLLRGMGPEFGILIQTQKVLLLPVLRAMVKSGYALIRRI